MNIKKNNYNTFFLVLLSSLFAACSSTPTTNQSPAEKHTPIDSPSSYQTRLDQHFKQWQGTPYKMGGQSKRGVDCSGFVQITYRDVFNKEVPRTTELQSDAGYKVSLDDVKFGDLLLFKTGLFKQHAGIYIGNGKFIHASSSKGVMSSSINNPYWSDSYQQTRRIIE